jgi:hypothetical protein
LRILLSILFIFSVLYAEATTGRYRCMWRDNPATTMVIGWDQIDGTAPVLYYDITDKGTDPTKYAFLKKPDHIIASKEMNNCFVRLTGLKPNTYYYFIIKDSDGVSRRMYFRTAPDNPATRLSIIAGGDSRNNREARKAANRVVSKLRPHMVLFNGDMTDGDIGQEWKDWLDDWQLTINLDGQIFPVLVARGNHEEANETLFYLFDLPTVSNAYALNFGGGLLKLITLNSLIATGGDQKAWLQRELESGQSSTWRFAQYHYPMRPHNSAKEEQDEQVINWATLFTRYQVQLGIESDAHVVKTTYPIRPSKETGSSEGFIRDEVRGTVYIGEGCWGAPLRRNDDDKPWTMHSGSFNHFKWIFVSQESVEIRTVKTETSERTVSVNKDNIFMIPAGIDIWKPADGRDVVVIKKKVITEAPDEILAARGGLEFTEFSTIRSGIDIAVKWSTKGETTGLSYELQRSVDGETYTPITQIKGKCLSPESSYSILDKGIASPATGGFVTYRIRHISPNGNSEFYDPQEDGKEVESWRLLTLLYSDPATNIVKVKYDLSAPGDVTIRLLNFRLKQVMLFEEKGQKPGTFVRSVDMASLPKGRYLLIIRHNQQPIGRYQVIKR